MSTRFRRTEPADLVKSDKYVRFLNDIRRLPGPLQEIITSNIERLLDEKFFSGQTMVKVKESTFRALDFAWALNQFYPENTDKKLVNAVVDLLTEFAKSDFLQDEYVKHTYYFIEPTEMTHNNVSYGFYVDPEALLKHILNSDSILQQNILNESTTMTQGRDRWSSNIADLCGSYARRRDMIGSVRLLFGLDDMRPYLGSAKKLMMAYLDIANYPIQMRRHNASGYTIAILERRAIDRAFAQFDEHDRFDLALNEFNQRLCDVLRNGFHLNDHTFPVSLSAFCTDNLGLG